MMVSHGRNVVRAQALSLRFMVIMIVSISAGIFWQESTKLLAQVICKGFERVWSIRCFCASCVFLHCISDCFLLSTITSHSCKSAGLTIHASWRMEPSSSKSFHSGI